MRPSTVRTTRGRSPYSQGVRNSATSSAAENGNSKMRTASARVGILVAALAGLPQEEEKPTVSPIQISTCSGMTP